MAVKKRFSELKKRKFPIVLSKNKLLVISLDALGAENVSVFKELPNFKRLLNGSSYCFNVSSVYPSLTYPAHCSIVTGCYPRKHGVINNTRLQYQKNSPDWFWQRKYIKVPTVYDEVIRGGGTVASILWPVTAKSKITWNMPEIFPNRRLGNQVATSLSNGSGVYQAVLSQKFGHLRKGRMQPALDDFATECAKYSIAKLHPGLTLLHLTDLDTQMHLFGTESSQAYDAILRHDRRLGAILDTMDENGLTGQMNVIVLGDHFQRDTSQVIYVNYWFLQKGWITVHGSHISDCLVYCKNCDGSAYVYIQKDHGYMKDAVRELLKTLASDPDNGIEQVIEGRDAAAMGADPHCSFMLEARDGYYFQDGFREPLASIDQMQSRPGNERMCATHGYLPGKPGYQTIFIAKGPDIREGVEIPSMCLVDEGPTMAALLGFSLPEADGKVLRSIL